MKPFLLNTFSRVQNFIDQRRFLVFITGVCLLAIMLVAISMRLYYSSGSFRLDLSRPEYTELRSEISKGSEGKNGFDTQGPINEQVLDEFLNLYKTEAKKVTKTKAFSSDVLSDEQLGLTGSANQQTE